MWRGESKPPFQFYKRKNKDFFGEGESRDTIIQNSFKTFPGPRGLLHGLAATPLEAPT